MNYKMDYRTCIFFCCYLMSVRVESKLFKNKSLQRRFMWKQMDDTVDDLMDGVMSGARVMKHMFSDLTSSTNVRHTVSPFDFMPSETTRVKYIFRSPSGKPMKTIKIRPPKKTIKIMTVAKPIVYEGKYYKPKIKFPSTEDMRKLEKQQEKMAEGRMPKKTSAEMLAEIESEKHVNEYKSGSKPVKSRQELLAEQESEKQTSDYKHYKDYKEFKDYKPQKPDEHHSEIVTGHIKEFSEDWTPVQQQPEQPEEVQLPISFSTIKPYALSELHTSITASSQSHADKENIYRGRLHTSITASSPAHHVDKEYYYPSSKSGKLHTSIIASSRYQTKSEKPIYEDTEHDQQLYEEAPNVHHSYEVTEYLAEESLALPLQQEYQHKKEDNENLSRSSSTTSTSTTTEEPNYPAEFLRKYRERTAAAATLKSNAASRFRPSEKLLDTSWIPEARNNSYAPTSKSHRSTNARTRSEKWPPELPVPAPFGTQAAASAVVESVTQGNIEPTLEPVRSKRKKMRFVTPLPNIESESRDKPRDVRQRGRVRFGDKLNADEY